MGRDRSSALSRSASEMAPTTSASTPQDKRSESTSHPGGHARSETSAARIGTAECLLRDRQRRLAVRLSDLVSPVRPAKARVQDRAAGTRSQAQFYANPLGSDVAT